MKTFIKRILFRLSGRPTFQRFLERNVAFSQYLMGIGSGAYLETSGENVIVEKLKQNRPTDRDICVFDVGSNKGEFVDLVETGLQGFSFHVHAFEPCRYSYNLLCDNAKNYSNVTLSNVGLGKSAGEFELFYDYPGSGLASLSKRRLEHFGVDFKLSEKVTIDTLDNYCGRQSVHCIDLLKLDVEGHEYDVLQGGSKMFNNRRIRMVLFEFGGTCIDSRTYLRDFFYFFRENGMSRMFRITPSGYLSPLQRYREADEQFCVSNFLVLQDDVQVEGVVSVEVLRLLDTNVG